MTDCKTYFFEDDGSIPNNPNLPLLVYPDVLSNDQIRASSCRQMLENHGWSRAWVNGIFSYHHYHSITHEVLAVLNGSANVMMGGENGELLSISTGDVIVIPAGVGHCNKGGSADFKVMGAYPGGKSYDLCTGKREERPQVLENIREVPVPELDPITGKKNPLHTYWKS